jgi:hypothetical protein
MTRRARTCGRLIGLVVLAAVSTGCLVLGLNRFADDASVTSDAHLIGVWRDADDGVTVTVEKSDWQSYRLSYVHPIATGQLTGYLFKLGGSTLVDLMPVRGQDPGVFTIAAHALVRVEIDDDTLTIAPLSYDWFARMLDAHTAPADLSLVRTERDQLVVTAGSEQVRTWLRERTASDQVFGPAATFTRERPPS